MTEQEELEDVVGFLKYFWEEKGDIERCSDFHDPHKYALLQKHRPDIIKAWQEYKTSILTLDNLLK